MLIEISSGKFSSLSCEKKKCLIEMWKFSFSLFQLPFIPDKKLRNKNIELLLKVDHNACLPYVVDSNTGSKNLLKRNTNLLPLNFLSNYPALIENNSNKLLDNADFIGFYQREFWSLVSSDDPDCIFVRFLVARKWSVEAAFRMLVDCLTWRGYEFNLNQLMISGEASLKPQLLQKGQVYFRGTDLQGRLLVHITVALHDKNAQTADEINRYVIYLIESGRQLLPEGTETFTIVFNMTNFSLSCMDNASIGFLINALSSYYPESLGCCLVVNPPLIFHGLYKIIQRFMDPVIQAKIHFIKSKELIRFLPNRFIPIELGGEDDFVYSYTTNNLKESSSLVTSSPDLYKILQRLLKEKEDFLNLTSQLIYSNLELSIDKNSETKIHFNTDLVQQRNNSIELMKKMQKSFESLMYAPLHPSLSNIHTLPPLVK